MQNYLRHEFNIFSIVWRIDWKTSWMCVAVCRWLPCGSMWCNSICHKEKVNFLPIYFAVFLHGSFEAPNKSFCQSIRSWVIGRCCHMLPSILSQKCLKFIRNKLWSFVRNQCRCRWCRRQRYNFRQFGEGVYHKKVHLSFKWSNKVHMNSILG